MSFFNELWDGLQGGFLRKPLKKATGLTDAQLLGAAGLAVAAPYALPTLGASGAAAGTAGASSAAPMSLGANVATTYGAVDAVPAAVSASQGAASGGLLDTMAAYGKPAMTALQGASMAKGLLGQQQPIQGAQLNKQAPQFSGLLTQPQNDDERRRQQYQQYVQNIGGRNGLAY